MTPAAARVQWPLLDASLASVLGHITGLAFAPVAVPRVFYVCVDFSATMNKGVYVGQDPVSRLVDGTGSAPTFTRTVVTCPGSDPQNSTGQNAWGWFQLPPPSNGKSVVVKESKATLSPFPGIDALRLDFQAITGSTASRRTSPTMTNSEQGPDRNPG